jgi:hypothetical protein
MNGSHGDEIKVVTVQGEGTDVVFNLPDGNLF